MHAAIRLLQSLPPAPPSDLLEPAVALCLAGGMTEAEALHALHARLIGRAAALGVRLYGEVE